jgi:hypothetical protein
LTASAKNSAEPRRNSGGDAMGAGRGLTMCDDSIGL